MNILAIAAHGLYEQFDTSFVHNQLKAYVKLGHRVRVIVPVALGKKTAQFGRIGRPIVTVVQDGVEIYYLRYISLGHFGENGFNPASAELTVKLLAKKLLKDFTPDIIHAHAILFAGRLAAALKTRCAAPIVITTHGGDTELSLKPEQSPRAKAICERAVITVAVSSACLKKLEKLGARTPSVCILNGFEARNAHVGSKKKHSLIQVNALRPDKHTELSVSAVDRLKELYPDISLNIVGGGAMRDSLAGQISRLGLEKYVRMSGPLPNKEAMSAMADSEIFIMPSVREGFGIVYLEAMACGCVAIGTQGEGIDGFIHSGENGFLVRPLDVEDITEKIIWCFDNPGEAAAIARKGRQDALALTWESNAEKYLALFESIPSRKRN